MIKQLDVIYTARVTVRECFGRYDLSAYRVAAEGQGQISRNTIYALARGEVERLDLGTLERLAGLLERLTGDHIGLGDLLTLERTA